MDIHHFDSDGVDIAYIDEGEGAPVLLIHGFASNLRTNWVDTAWVETLLKAGYRVIAIDNRGHGDSEKLYDTADYGAPVMAEDARRLIEHAGIEKAAVMGYSMGARITAFLALNHPDRVNWSQIDGLGINMVRGVGAPEPIAEALEAASIEDVTDPGGRVFRMFAEQTGSDLLALAACMRSSRVRITEEALSQLRMPVLVAVGTDDAIGGRADELAAMMPEGRSFPIQGRDHMKAVGDRSFKAAVVEFLAEGA